MKAVGIAACSNGLKQDTAPPIGELITVLRDSGVDVILSGCIYENNGPFSGTAEQRAGELMKLFQNPDIEEIYDVSGGDMANEVLDKLDYAAIRNSRAVFWGYSDLTTVLNAIYAKTGKSGVLYQIRNLVGEEYGGLQRRRYLNREELFSPSVHMIQGGSMEGILIGGNIRCFLKLAGTEYFPDPKNRILLLEARSGRIPQMVTYLSQMKSMGVFGKIQGILLGTFTEMEREHLKPDMAALVRSFAGEEIPIAVTEDIGHGPNSCALPIGGKIRIYQYEDGSSRLEYMKDSESKLKNRGYR